MEIERIFYKLENTFFDWIRTRLIEDWSLIWIKIPFPSNSELFWPDSPNGLTLELGGIGVEWYRLTCSIPCQKANTKRAKTIKKNKHHTANDKITKRRKPKNVVLFVIAYFCHWLLLSFALIGSFNICSYCQWLLLSFALIAIGSYCCHSILLSLALIVIGSSCHWHLLTLALIITFS